MTIREARLLPINRGLASYTGVGTLLTGIVFWYGGGVIRASELYLRNGGEMLFLFIVFCLFTSASYILCRSAYWVAKRPVRFVERVSFRRVSVGVAALLLLYGAMQIIGGSLASNHAVRILQVAGIVAGVYVLSEYGRRKLVAGGTFLLSLSLAFAAYSRRPVMTIVFAPVALFVLGPARRSRMALLGLTVAFVLIGLVLTFLTGLRGTEWSGDLSRIGDILESGWLRLSEGSGFDSVWLLDYVIDTYQTQEPFLWGKSIYGALLNPIPRELWAGKPMAFSIELSSIYFNVTPDTIPTNFGPGIIAEAYANGGPLMVCVWAIGLGYLTARFDVYVFRHSHELLGQLMLVIVPPALFFLIRGDMLNSFYEFYIKAVPAALLAIYARRRYVNPGVRPILIEQSA